MSPRPNLVVIQGGCAWEWVTPEAHAEALALLDAGDPYDRYDVDALIQRAEKGLLRPHADVKGVATAPDVLELRIETTRPRLRLYIGEGTRGRCAVAIGLLLAPKPTGTPAEQRRTQNADIALAVQRLQLWTP